uniref:uncharacterized protein LOC118150215 isoform X2 n=1 Tax=Callithrix jacchus TaxID=9483 RepID=UPI00159F5B9A|nr:uncharacterized protein LOC118150215 isoform X2 [Callithrix jacchus]
MAHPTLPSNYIQSPGDNQSTSSLHDDLISSVSALCSFSYKSLSTSAAQLQPAPASFLSGLPADPNKPELSLQLSSCYLGLSIGQRGYTGSHIWCRNPGVRVVSLPGDPLPPATSPDPLRFDLSTPDKAGLKLFLPPPSLPTPLPPISSETSSLGSGCQPLYSQTTARPLSPKLLMLSVLP